MKLILHIGTGKTGTTSIQTALYDNHEKLQSLKISYPIGDSKDHNILEASVLEFGKLHRVYRSMYSENHEKPKNIAMDLIQKIKSSNSDYLVLSGEYFFALGSSEAEVLLDLLEVSPSDVKVICYVRNPSSYWLSGVQQYLKGSWNLDGLISSRYRFKNGLINWGNVVGYDNVIVRQFSKSKLIGNDIVTDFCNVLSEITNCKVTLPSPGLRNTSVYSEQCILMQELRQELLSVPDNTFNSETRKLNRQIHLCSENLELTKMVFKPEVIQYIECLHSEDMDWLKETFDLDIGLNINMNNETINSGEEIVLSNKVKNMLDKYNLESLSELENRVRTALLR